MMIETTGLIFINDSKDTMLLERSSSSEEWAFCIEGKIFCVSTEELKSLAKAIVELTENADRISTC